MESFLIEFKGSVGGSELITVIESFCAKEANKTIETKAVKIDSLETAIKEIESSIVLVDSICVRWGFLTKHLDENCKEWKLILVK